MKGEQNRVNLANRLLALNQTLQETIDYLKQAAVSEGSQQIILNLLSVQQEVIAEYDELYLLLKADYLLNCEDFQHLHLKYLDLKPVPKSRSD